MGEIRIAGIWRTTAAPDDVWAVVADLSTWPQWWPAIRAVDLLDGSPGRPGAARLTFATPAPLPALVVEVEAAEVEPPSRLVVAPRRGPLAGSGRLEVSPDHAGASAVAYDVRLRFRSLVLRPLEAVLAGATRASGRERLRQAGDDLARLAGGEPGEHEP